MNIPVVPASRSLNSARIAFHIGFALVWFLLAPSVSAQWLTQSVTLTKGWNGVFLHVDPSHTTLDVMVGADSSNPILEIWQWNLVSNIQFFDDADLPIDNSSPWTTWERTASDSSLQRLLGNSAYLVHVGDNGDGYVWSIQGKPVAPRNDWTSTGLNFIGFPTTPGNSPSFESFLAQAPELLQSPETEIYRYGGGGLSLTNPEKLVTYRGVNVNRGQAYWVRSGSIFNHYFGPVKLELQNGYGIDFQEGGTSEAFFLENLTGSSLTISLNLAPSETPPNGQTAISAVPPLLIRGELDFATGTYGYTNLEAGVPYHWTLAPAGQPGSKIEVVLGINRTQLSDTPGAFYAGILSFTDSLGYTQLDTAVTATSGSTAGLWVGRAMVTEVGQHLKSFDTDRNGNPLLSDKGQYIVTGTDLSLAPVPRPYPLRLIVHNPESGNAALLQRIFLGLDENSNFVASNSESVLDRNSLDLARRISAIHLPWSNANLPWMFDGHLSASTSLKTSVELDYNSHGSNPFLHTYHPDHDNLDPTFKQVLLQGSESYSLQRDITLNIHPPMDDFSSQVSGSKTLRGEYRETMRVLGLARDGEPVDTRDFEVRGSFTLNRISDISTLTIVP